MEDETIQYLDFKKVDIKTMLSTNDGVIKNNSLGFFEKNLI